MGEVEEFVNLINGQLPSVYSKFCIYKIPQKIRELNEKAYDPRVISIGPFHHGNKRYQSMEAFKMKYLKKVIQRNTRVGLHKYVEFLKEREMSVRQCYSEIIEMNSYEFVTMLLLDGCFLIELFRCYYYDDCRDEEYSILTSTRLENDIDSDLILLENQIPFFILEDLFNIAMEGIETVPLLNLAITYFDFYNTQKKLAEDINYSIQHFTEKSANDINSIKHFTDLILILHRPISPTSKMRGKRFQNTKSATELDEAGVKLKMGSSKCLQNTKSATELDEAGVKFKMGSSKCLLDIKFSSSNGVLKIPHLKLHDGAESTIRNLMALELCQYPLDSYLIDYLKFMNDLVNTPKDVDLLVQSGIIKNGLGDSKQAADFFNNMNTHIIEPREFYFSSISEELNAYCMIPSHKWRAALKRDYFSTPWRSASTSAAIVLLVLTFIQTVYSILSSAQG